MPIGCVPRVNKDRSRNRQNEVDRVGERPGRNGRVIARNEALITEGISRWQRRPTSVD